MACGVMRVFGLGSLNGNILFVVLALPALIAAEKECLPGVTYLDTVTGNCDPCSDICELAEQQGTVARCQTLCKGYVPISGPASCPPGQFYDPNVGRCDHCRSICLQPTEDCRRHCPDWGTIITPASPDMTTPESYTSHTTPGQDKQFATGSMVTYSILGAVFGTLGLCLIILAGFCLWKRYSQVLPCGKNCNKRPKQEQGQGQGHPMIPPTNPIDRNGRGPFASPEEEDHMV